MHLPTTLAAAALAALAGLGVTACASDDADGDPSLDVPADEGFDEDTAE